MKIAFIGDCKGKVHYSRYKAMQQWTSHSFDFFTIKQKNLSKMCASYDAVYYALYTMYKRHPVKHSNIYGSATSWKCIFGSDHKRDMQILSRFHRLSANNLSLCRVIQKQREDVQYIPNGVDTDFFCPVEKTMNNPLVIGWAGNTDRAEKNYPIFKKICKKCGFVEWKKVTTLKSTSFRKMRSAKEMREFYRSLDYFLVISSYEGTPNPALEAASCGVPLISTLVGNMPELIREGETGFFVRPSVSSVKCSLDKICNISPQKHAIMRHSIRDSMKNWNWPVVCKRFDSFFR